MTTETYRHSLLTNWEDIYKKGQLTFWILLALKEGKKYAEQVKNFIEQSTANAFTCEEVSLYRSLRKFYDLEIVDYETGEGNKGPERKYYFLTPLGKDLLKEFIGRNILLFYQKDIARLITRPED